MARQGLAELGTGEGKTLAATLPATVAALAGILVHVITSNDYLVERDAEAMGPLYTRLGITVGTRMAGRGTDIRLGPGVARIGGLHVIATELGEARRIDRQLFGRCARQGDPGSFERLVSLEDRGGDRTFRCDQALLVDWDWRASLINTAAPPAPPRTSHP